MAELKVIVFGDSIAVGDGVPVHKGWVYKISESISEDYEGVVVYNSSVSGETTRQALLRMSYNIFNKGFKIMVLQFGLNDCNRWKTESDLPRVNITSFKHNLMEIIEKSMVDGIEHFIINTNHPSSIKYYQDDLKEYNKVIREVANFYGDSVQLMDIEDMMLRNMKIGHTLEDFVLPDGVHLTERGHTFYYRYLYVVLERIFVDNYDYVYSRQRTI